MDKAIEYLEKLDAFVKLLNDTNKKGDGETWVAEKGRKFDRVFIKGTHQNFGRYFVDRNSWQILGIKSWAQVNPRRTYGTLDTVQDYDWIGYVGTPKVGTVAEKEHLAREASIAKNYAKRGRPRKI